MKVDVLSDTGAYGNHSIGVLFHGCAESISLYNCPVKRVDAEVVYTNNVPSGAFRGYGLGQVILGIESALDELAIELGIDPFELRRINAVARRRSAARRRTPSPRPTWSTAATGSTSASTWPRRRCAAATASRRRPAIAVAGR